MKKERKLKTRSGFTMVELIVVIAIIGILAAVLVPSLTGYITKAKNSVCDSNLALCNRAMAYDSIENATSDDATFLERCQRSVGGTIVEGDDGYRYLDGLCPRGGKYYLVAADMDDGKKNEFESQFVVHCTHHNFEETKISFDPNGTHEVSTFESVFKIHYSYYCADCKLYTYAYGGDGTQCKYCNADLPKSAIVKNKEQKTTIFDCFSDKEYSDGACQTINSGLATVKEIKSAIGLQFGIPVGYPFEFFAYRDRGLTYSSRYSIFFAYDCAYPTFDSHYNNIVRIYNEQKKSGTQYTGTKKVSLNISGVNSNVAYGADYLKMTTDEEIVSNAKPVSAEILNSYTYIKGSQTYFLNDKDKPLTLIGYLYNENTDELLKGTKQEVKFVLNCKNSDKYVIDSDGQLQYKNASDTNNASYTKFHFYYTLSFNNMYGGTASQQVCRDDPSARGNTYYDFGEENYAIAQTWVPNTY